MRLVSVALEANSGLGPLIAEISRLHTIGRTHAHTHTVRLIWTSDKPVAEAATYTTHNKHKRRTSMSSLEFEPAIAAIERPQT
jgi:hypothetical protein